MMETPSSVHLLSLGEKILFQVHQGGMFDMFAGIFHC